MFGYFLKCKLERGKEMWKKFHFVWVFCALQCETSSGSSSTTRITLPQGYVTGISIFTDFNNKIHAYLGIPYALPPIGDLRFASPERHPGWNGTLFAGHFRPDCVQLRQDDLDFETDAMNEDCLYLNVFVPEVALIYKNFPVVIFIEGIDYVAGSPLIVTAEELAKEGIIVVTFSYRLNVFGFITFEDKYSRGNLGLLDQYMAFMWVKENIEYFGGMSKNVTLMGHGSGASSILIHMTSPRTKNLFQKVILMSGSIFSPWLMSHPRSKTHPALIASRIIARSLGCFNDNYIDQKSLNILTCLRKKTSSEILRAFQSAYQNGNWSNALGPISDDFLPPGAQYLPTDPTEAVRIGNFHKLPIMTGITCNEGTITLNNWKELIDQTDGGVRHFTENTAIGNILEKYDVVGSETRKVVEWNYLAKVSKNRKVIHQLLKLYNDAMYLAPFWHQTQILSKNSDSYPVYVYVFSQPSFDYIGNYRESLNLTASVHGSEILFLFGPSLYQKLNFYCNPWRRIADEAFSVRLIKNSVNKGLEQISGRRFSTIEEGLSVKMKAMWAYYIRLGNPTPPSQSYGIWNKYDIENENYLKMHINRGTGRIMQQLSENPDKEATTFWNFLLPKLYETTKQRIQKYEELLFIAGVSNSPTNSGNCTSYKNAMFTVLAFLILLLIMLILSLIFLKKRTKERDRCAL